MKNLVIIFVLFAFGSVNAQTVFLDQPYEIGYIDKSSQRYVDVPIKNTSDKKVFIFRAEADKRFQIRYSSKELLPDSTVYMRVQFNPEVKGPFSEKIAIHFSCYSEPKTIKVTGFTQDVPTLSINCPSFSAQDVNTSLHLQLEIKVIDKGTREPIQKAQVILIKNGIPLEKLLTNSKGFVEKEVELGLYYFVVSAQTYLPVEFVKYVNRNNNVVLVELEKAPEKELPVIETNNTDEDNPEDLFDPDEIESTPTVEIIIDEVEVQDTISEVIVEIEDDPYPHFSVNEFKPSNIVFLVDVSRSMAYTGKLDLLKVAMINLAGMLRDVDQITMVSYSDNANIILETMQGNNPDTIISIIQGLKAHGHTAGGKGMKKAYQKAEEFFIPQGNNQVIMATDGGFTQKDINPYKLAKKYKKKGITISIVGVKTNQLQELSLEKVVGLGDGNYVRIKNYEEAQGALIDEIKSSAKRE
ncbi:MAG: VWA domain-containing protein [Flavobacteriales bacterium]|nr:VWA domain-containing protein [Flavobacteriales bacterium]